MTDIDKPLRIIYLEAENVKRLKAVRIRPDKTLVRIEGRNAQGKTSVLDAIAAALGGGKWQPEMPVRKGERKAKVKLDLGELQVERRWTAAGGTVLEITANGKMLSSPQAILDKLVGDLTFDPLAFASMKPAQQNELLKRLVGLDFDALEAKRATLYAERTVMNREAKAAEARVGPMPPKPPGEVVDIQAIAQQQKAATIAQQERAQKESVVQQALHEFDSAVKRLDEAKQLQLTAGAALRTAQADLAKLQPVQVPDFAAQIAHAQQVNAAIAARESWEGRAAHAKALANKAEKLNAEIGAIDAEKSRLLLAAEMPLPGITLEATGPYLNGVPFSEASSAEKLRTSVAIGLATKPKARIMLCRDGSLLDRAGHMELHKIAEEFDAQVFVEVTADEASPSAVFIEDGEVVETSESVV